MNTFEEIFNNFIRKTYPNAEVIADIFKKDKIDFQNADYFFENRRIVGELKCLESDFQDKIQAYIDKLINEGVVYPFYGKISMGKLLEKHPEKTKISVAIINKIISSLEDCFEKANRQIRETKEYFGVPEARGFVIIVNRSNLVLEPQIAFYHIHKLLNKKTNNRVRYESVDFGIFTTDRHFFKEGNMNYIPLLAFINDISGKYDVQDEKFLYDFKKRWSNFRNVPFFDKPEINFNDAMHLPFKIIKD